MAEGRTNAAIAARARRHPRRGREAHLQHLRQARPAGHRRRPPPRARRAHVPARGAEPTTVPRCRRPSGGVCSRASSSRSPCTASAVSAAVLLLAADLAPGPGIHVPVDPTQAGEPQTVMIVGSDRRGDGLSGALGHDHPRDGLDKDRDGLRPSRRYPRDLLVDYPGCLGRDVKINAAYDHGGATVARCGRSSAPPPGPSGIHRVIAVDFGRIPARRQLRGLRPRGPRLRLLQRRPRARRLREDRRRPRLSEALRRRRARRRALSPRRQRPLTAPPASRRSCASSRGQPGVARLMDVRPGNLRELARVFRANSRHGDRLRGTSELLRFAKTVLVAADKPVRQVPFRAVPAPRDPNSLVASPGAAPAHARGAAGGPAAHAPPARRRPPGGRDAAAAGLVDARRAGEDQRASPSGERARLPARVPGAVTATARYDAARTYRVAGHRAYRLVLATGRVGEYYGVQGTTWRDRRSSAIRTRRSCAAAGGSTSTATARASGSSPGARAPRCTGSRTCSPPPLRGRDARDRGVAEAPRLDLGLQPELQQPELPERRAVQVRPVRVGIGEHGLDHPGSEQAAVARGGGRGARRAPAPAPGPRGARARAPGSSPWAGRSPRRAPRRGPRVLSTPLPPSASLSAGGQRGRQLDEVSNT